ncbi:MAG: sugar phosphate isomerase/epimerase family protein [Verrucomicrobiota bacterium]
MKNHPVSESLVSRRDFVSRLALAGAALPLAGSAAYAQAEGAKKKAAPAGPTSGTGKVGALHVFSKPLHFLSYEDTAKMIAEAGFGGIDYTVRKGGHVLPEKVKEDLPRAVEAAKKAGLKVEMITTDIVSAKDPLTEPLLRTAAGLGVKVYRFGNFAYDEKLGVMGSLAKHRTTIKELGALNQSLGIHGAIQNHAGTRVGAALWDLYEILRESDPKWTGVQYDIRHAVAEGGQSWSVPLKLLAPWIKCIDLKDFKWEQLPGKANIDNVPIGEGIVPFDAYFKLVRELGINGPASVHFEYPPFERAQIPEAEKRPKLLAAMKKDLAALKPHLAKHQLG